MKARHTGIVCVLAVGMAVSAGVETFPGQAPVAAGAGSQTGVPRQPAPYQPLPPIFQLNDEAYLRWPLPRGAEAYASIEGPRMKTYVEELAVISRKSRDDGNRYWGRITGTPSDAQSQAWLAAKLRQLQIDVRFEALKLPPLWFPTEWEVSASAGSRTLELGTAAPPMRTPATHAGGLELETVYVGLGTPADFMGRVVGGKAVVIHSLPTPSVLNHSARWNGAIARAVEKGAAALLIVIDIPGNRTSISYPIGADVPAFTLGLEDGVALRQLIETGEPVKVRLRLSVDRREGLETASVWGKLPGMTDENIMVLGHLDGYFEAALDNASGVAVMVGLAEYYARLPTQKRRRTLYFVAPAAHHEGDLAAKVWHETMKPFFAKTALILNCEHISVTQTYLFNDKLRRSTTVDARRFILGPSRRLGAILVGAARLFGVGLYDAPEPRPLGALAPIWQDAPSLEVIESPNFYHTDFDRADIVPATGLEASARAYAKIIDEINQLDLKDIVDVGPATARR